MEIALQGGVAHHDLPVALAHPADRRESGEQGVRLLQKDLLVAQVLLAVFLHQAAEGAGQHLVAVADAEQRPAAAFQEFEQAGLGFVVADHFLRTGNDERGKSPGVGKNVTVAHVMDIQLQAGGRGSRLQPGVVALDLFVRLLPVTVDQHDFFFHGHLWHSPPLYKKRHGFTKALICGREPLIIRKKTGGEPP